MEQKAQIERLNNLLSHYKQEKEGEISPLDDLRNGKISSNNVTKPLRWNDEEEIIKEKCEIKKSLPSLNYEMETLLDTLTSELQSATKSVDRLISQSPQLRKSDEELEKERERSMEMESEWICLTDELRVEERAEKVEMELRLDKKCSEELDDALMRILQHGKMVEHDADLQEKYDELAVKHRLVMEGIAEVRRAAAKAGAEGHGKQFLKSLAAELSVLRVEKEKERELLKKGNRSPKI